MGGGGGNISITKSISGDIDNHENLINQVHNMPTTEVIGVVNSLDKDQILDF